MRATVKYSQCWEDPDVLRRALSIGHDDDVVSIASGGDNTLALLLDHPKSVTAVDMNPAQLYLLELKVRAIQIFEYGDFIRFIGIKRCKQRILLYRRLRHSLTSACRQFWDGNYPAIKRGIIHSGKFERYLNTFNSFVLPAIHSENTVRSLLACSSTEEQFSIYRETWDSRRWRLLFRLFFSRIVLGNLGRDRSHFRYVSQRNIAGELMERTRRGITQVPVRSNHFLRYMLTGQYTDLDSAPPYLREENFLVLRRCLSRLNMHCGDLTQFLRTRPGESFSRFNLSDMLEYMSPIEIERLLTELLRVSRPESRAAFWTLFVRHEVPSNLNNEIRSDVMLQGRLRSIDRGFFYNSFCLWHIRPVRAMRKPDCQCQSPVDERTAHA